jgi:hypothetical protein
MRGEKIAMTPGGSLCVLIPLYTRVGHDPLDKLDGYAFQIVAEPESPVGYLMDWEETGTQAKFFNEKILSMVEVLGEL